MIYAIKSPCCTILCVLNAHNTVGLNGYDIGIGLQINDVVGIKVCNKTRQSMGEHGNHIFRQVICSNARGDIGGELNDVTIRNDVSVLCFVGNVEPGHNFSRGFANGELLFRRDNAYRCATSNCLCLCFGQCAGGDSAVGIDDDVIGACGGTCCAGHY